MKTRRVALAVASRRSRAVDLRHAVGVLFGCVVVGTLLWWLVFVRFLLSLPGLLATSIPNAAVAYLLTRWVAVPERMRGLFPLGRPRTLLVSLVALVIAGAMFPLFSGILPDAYTRHHGSDVTFQTTAEKKTKARGFYIRLQESRAVGSRTLSVDRFLWDRLSVGDTVLITGKESILGISVSNIRPKR